MRRGDDQCRHRQSLRELHWEWVNCMRLRQVRNYLSMGRKRRTLPLRISHGEIPCMT